MEGVDEALARIAAHTYVIDSARAFTTVAIDQGEKPAVVSAIMKYHATERGRSVVNDAMDVHGGKGICLGPGNYLGRAYQQVPVAITVEGANILTRSLIIFGQGALRCHPFLQREMAAARAPVGPAATRAFDAALWGHARFLAGNFLRASFHGLSGARWAAAAGVPATRSLVRELSRLSAAFAFTADVALLTLGGGLKRREKLSGRLADALSQLYLASATLKRFHDDGAPAADVPLVRWALEDACHRAEQALVGVVRNLPNRWAAALVRLAVLPLGERCRAPSDRLGTDVARALCTPGEVRERLTRGVFSPPLESDPVGRLDLALSRVERVEALRAVLATAVRDGVITGDTEGQRQAAAQARGLLSADDARFLEDTRRLERACVMVDDFPRYLGRVRAAEVPALAEVTLLPAVRRAGTLR
jgi:acyl-CoA dehydrogenase